MVRAIVKRAAATLDAVLGGLTVGEKVHEGEHMKAVAMGLALAAPLVWKRRLGSIALAVAAAALAYWFFDEMHEREPILVETPTGGHQNGPSTNP